MIIGKLSLGRALGLTLLAAGVGLSACGGPPPVTQTTTTTERVMTTPHIMAPASTTTVETIRSRP